MQVDPIKTNFKLPGTKRLRLKCDGPLSNFAFKFKLRRYNLDEFFAKRVGAIKRQYAVGRCRLTLSNPS